MKTSIGQIEIRPENIAYHFGQIQETITAAKEKQQQLLLFPAFSITGYLPTEATLFADFYSECEKINEQIAQQAKDITIVWGSIQYEKETVRPTIFIAQNQQIIFTTDSNAYCPLTLGTETISLGLWWQQVPSSSAPVETEQGIENTPILDVVFYANPRQALAATDATVTPRNYTNPTLLLRNTELAYEGKNIFLCPGNSQYILPQANSLQEVPTGQNGLFLLEEIPQVSPTAPIEKIYQRTILGIRTFMAISHLKKVVIGLSGGIDSALNACLYEQAIGKENVFLVNMPSRYNSQLTQNLAQTLSENLGCFYGVFPIENSVKQTVQQLENTVFYQGKNKEKHRFTLQVSNFTQENIQARDRGSRLLAAIAQSISGVFTANCNKTEIAVGYATMYGDQAGFLAATGNLWKQEVYALAQYMDDNIYHAPFLKDIIQIKPSAELSPQQDITQGLGDPLIYDYHDKLLAAWQDRAVPLTLEKILSCYEQKTLGAEIGCDQNLINIHFPTAQQFITDLEKWWQAYQGMATVKKIQSPPILIVHNPPRTKDNLRIRQPYYSKAYLEKKTALLKK